MNKLVLLIFIILINLDLICQNTKIQKCNLELIKAIMEDVFSPPVASRIHLTTNLAAYEVLSLKDANYLSLSGQIKHLPDVTHENIENVNLDMAAEVAFLKTALYFIYTEDAVQVFYKKEMEEWKSKLSEVEFAQSEKYGIETAKNVLEWVKKDNYGYTRTMHRYELTDSLGAWVPTPPEYRNALEPNWMYMRKLTMDSNQFIKARPNMAYSEDKNSQFYKNAMAVYNTFKNLTPQQREIANYWDDNPQTTVSKGHVSYIFKKPTPGGHWMKITSQVISKLDMDELEAAELFTMVSVGMYEAFIHCWYTKYKTNAIRPSTYLERLGYTDFSAILETPNFPEYTSGHSAVSRSITTILSHYVSDNYAFVDSAQVLLGLKPRQFTSFYQASEEVSFSRFCGGIHYLPSLVYGAEQGHKVANHVLKTIRTRKNFTPKVH